MNQSVTFLRYDSYKPANSPWLQSVPSHWKLLPGLAVLKANKDRNFGMIEEVVLSLSYGKVIIKPPEKFTGLVPESFETYQIINPNDIIIRPTDLQNDHTSLRTGLAKDRGIITSAYICLRPDPSHNPAFIHYLLHSYDLFKVYYGMGSGLRQNLDYRDFKRLELCIPSRDEQDRIVNFLDQKTNQINEAIAKKQRLIELLKEQKTILINQAVTKGLNPNVPMRDSGVEWVGDVPAHWMPQKLKLSVKFIDGDRSSNYPSDTDIVDSGIPFLSSKNIIDNKLNFENVNQISEKKFRSLGRGKLKHGDLVITVRGTIGNIAIFDPLEFNTGFINAQMMIMRPFPELKSQFLLFIAQCDLWRKQLSINSYGSAQQQLSGQILKNIYFSLPPLREQESILLDLENELGKIKVAIGSAVDSVSLLKEFQMTIISSAVTGKIKI